MIERIPSLFNSSPDASRARSIPPDATLPVDVRTSDEQWAYAVRFRRQTDATAPSTAVLIRLALSVSSGTVGVGCLNVSETAFVDETFVNAMAAPTHADVVVSDPTDLGPLIVRNASSIGPSEVRLLRLECFALTTCPESERTPGLSDPRPCANWSRYYGSTGETIEEKLRVQSFLSASEPLIVRWVDGLSVRVLPGDQLSRALYVSGTYEPNTLCLVRALLGKGDIFIDVGANVGVISLVASKRVGPTGHVYSFEPSLREYENLRDNLERNNAAHVKPLHAAVASSSGHATLRVAPSSHSGLNTLGGTLSYAVGTERIEQVATITLDDFVDHEKIARVALVKLDVEGAEGSVLQGAERVLRDLRPSLIFEVFSRSLEANGSSVKNVEDQLRRARYQLYSISDDSARLHPLDVLGGCDEQNVVALPAERSAQILERLDTFRR
jgi:FkbM family methyltransferase